MRYRIVLKNFNLSFGNWPPVARIFLPVKVLLQTMVQSHDMSLNTNSKFCTNFHQDGHNQAKCVISKRQSTTLGDKSRSIQERTVLTAYDYIVPFTTLMIVDESIACDCISCKPSSRLFFHFNNDETTVYYFPSNLHKFICWRKLKKVMRLHSRYM